MKSRFSFAAGYALLCVQLVAIAGVFLAPEALRPIEFALIALAALATLLLYVMDQRYRAGYRKDNTNRLASWLSDLDLEQTAKPELDQHADYPLQTLADAAIRLVTRVEDYREKLWAQYRQSLRKSRDATEMIYQTDNAGRMSWVSDSSADLLGFSPSELVDHPLTRLLADPEKDAKALLEEDAVEARPVRVLHREGQHVWLLITTRRIENASGEPIGHEGFCRDGTLLIETQRLLGLEKQRAEVTLTALDDGVITTDAKGLIDFINPAARRILALGKRAAIGHDFDSVCRLYDDETEEPVVGMVDAVLEFRNRHDPHRSLMVDQGPGGRDTRRWVTVNISPIHVVSEEISGVVVVLHDVSRLHSISRELTYQTTHDSLTGLLNRRAFEQRMNAIIEASTEHDLSHALCCIDLDQFKFINDSCGHQAGDAMLRQISSRIGAELRAGDIFARLSGDMFGLLMEHTTLENAERAAERMRTRIEAFHFNWQGRIFRLGASIGLTLITARSVSPTELLRQADTACYIAKERGRNRVQIYSSDSDEARMREYDIERMQQINVALEGKGFELYAQPIRSLDDPNRGGLELLLRFDSKADNERSPQNLLLAAERYNMAPRIDRWVIANALALIARRQQELAAIDYFSINISGQSITDEQFVNYVHDHIGKSGVNPHRLVFEITETAAVTNLQRAGALMRSLRMIGCRFALDDFGSGLSSFSYLKHLPSDFVKIDGELVNRMMEDPVEHSIIEAIGRVSSALGLRTIAEHVETQAQYSALKEIGIDSVQGYYLGQPIPFEQVEAMQSAAI